MTQYLLAYQQQEALRRQREAEMNDPTALLLHLSKLQSMQNPISAPLATSPEKIEKIHEDSKSSEDNYKMVIKNGVLMKKQKQRRYRTERPHECACCNARFTLRSNMERHIKQQHGGDSTASDNASSIPHELRERDMKEDEDRDENEDSDVEIQNDEE